MLELYQAEWCPYSKLVRQRLTELGIGYITHQVPVHRNERHAVIALSGQTQIPVLVQQDTVIAGSDAILAHLDSNNAEPISAIEHRARAAEKRREDLQHSCREFSTAA